jgi:outer membrane immunogenic protein
MRKWHASLVGLTTTAALVLGGISAAQAQTSWSGFYLGANVGAAWTDIDASFANVPGPVVGGGDGTYSLDGTGFIGGLHAGFNWQSQQLVLGLEGDISWLGANGESAAVTISPVLFPGFSETLSAETNWIAMLRARIGWAFTPSLMAYLTGGFAWGDVDVGYTAALTGAGASTFSASDSSTNTGWTIGGGLEWALTRNWLVRAEYLYVDLGSTTLTTPANATSGATSTRFEHNADILRAGISYKF